MAASEMVNRCLNPVILNLKKMELELKCPTCLNLFDQPILMPCTHIFCSPCITNLARNGECPSCNSSFLHQDLRPADHIKSFVTIYKNMNSAVAVNFLGQGSDKTFVTHEKMPANESPASGNNYTKETLQSGRAKNVPKDTLPDPQIDASNIMTRDRESNGVIDKAEQYSPPSFGSIKDLDCDDSDQGSKHGSKKHSLVVNEEDIRNEQREEINVGKSKRQKLDNEFNVGVNGNSDAEYNYGSLLDASRYVNRNTTVECVFCHSSSSSKASGKMLHLLNGKEVDMDQATLSNVFHVHENCIEWAPKIYYSGDTVMNLENELTRASKIKCNSCGQKGAALGCYVKSCKRSYHVPCAYEILECRWDCENYLLLCPAHSKHKLPCDRSKSRLNSKATHSSHSSTSLGDLDSLKTGHHEHSRVSPGAGQNWVFCGSALSKEEKGLIDQYSYISGAVVSNSWESSVTHVIASVDENGGCSRTLKFLLAILTGKWVLSTEWVKACLEAGHPLQEEPYEITHDVHGVFDGPKVGRMRAMQKAPKLLIGLSFYIISDFERPGFEQSLEDLILAGGGTLVKKDELLHFQESTVEVILPKVFVIYNGDLPLKDDSRDPDEVLKQSMHEAEALAARTGGRAIRHTNFLDNIAACCFQMN